MSKFLRLRPRDRGKESGQGLVEYALIVVLVAIVVVVILALFGPAIGNVFSTVLGGVRGAGSGGAPTATSPAPTATAPAPTPTPTALAWTFCANEHTFCSIGSGSHPVRYGANGTYFTQTFVGPTNVDCSNTTFGDPLVGTFKHCDYQ